MFWVTVQGHTVLHSRGIMVAGQEVVGHRASTVREERADRK